MNLLDRSLVPGDPEGRMPERGAVQGQQSHGSWRVQKREEKHIGGASLVAQWLRICPLMQGTRVQALVWEDPTCRGATRPVSHNY